MADRCNIPNYILRDNNSKLAIPLPQTNVKKNSFFWSSSIDQRQATEVSCGFEDWLQTILPEIYTVLT